MKNEKFKKLFAQVMKFALVGGISFLIDMVITLIVDAILRKTGLAVGLTKGFNASIGNLFGTVFSEETVSSSTGSVFGFCISLIFNYVMSMKIVFARKDDMDRRKEFLIFMGLSLIGLVLNTIIMLVLGVATDSILSPEFNQQYASLIAAFNKCVATGVVMVYNFISRKLTLEKKEETEQAN